LARPWGTSRLWPSEPTTAADPRTVASALAIGVFAALALRPQLPGLAYLLTGVGVLAVALSARTGRLSPPQTVAALFTVALLAVALARSAPWLVALAVVGACFVGSLALVGGRTWTGLVVGAFSSGLAPGRAGRWVQRSLVRIRVPSLRSGRLWLVVGVTAGLVVLFGALFVTADPAYAELLDRAVPSLDVPGLAGRLPVLCAVATATLVAAYLAHHPPRVDALAPAAGRPLRRWEWGVPLVVLDLLFLSFVLVQLTVLFGDEEHVLATSGLTYAEYARQGFWQLLVVTVLTLVVIAVATRTAPRTAASDRVVVRVLLALLCLLTLVVVASALHRMSLYEQQFGFTRLRLFVSAVELTLGAIFVLLLAAGVRLRGRWLPRAVVALAAVAVLALAAVNPDAYIAEQNVARYERSGRIDVAYLATLSPDAVPALDRLPADLRSCALQRVASELAERTEHWYDLNLSRERARRLVERQPVAGCPTVQVGAMSRR
jgi:hypothetical protein